MRRRHDALVMDIVDWLTGQAGATLPDPLERAHEVIQSLSRQKRYEQAQSLQEACDHLMSVCRSYRSLVEARGLCFAALWPESANGDGPGVRMNLVQDGRLCEVVSLRSGTIEQGIGAALARLSPRTVKAPGGSATPLFVAVPQKELDTLLAVRRWFHEGTTGVKITLPAALGHGDTGPLVTRLVTEAFKILSSEPAAREAQPVV